MGDENDVGTIDYLNECDGTLLQFCIIGLFFSSMNYLDFLSPFSSAGHLCDLKGIDCDKNNKLIEAISFHNKSLTGNLITLITEIGLIESVKKNRSEQ